MAAKSLSDNPLPSTMRAWQFTQPGLLSTTLTLTENLPLPQPTQPNDILIKISHCGFNLGVTFIAQLLPTWSHKTPATPELDFSGIVIATGPSLPTTRPDLPPGTPVFGSCPPPLFFRHGTGSLAEYILLPSPSTVSPLPCPLPLPLPMDQAASLSGCGCTALQLVRKAHIHPGSRVLIHGGSGGLGSILVQVVKAAVGDTGTVVATCSPAKMGFVRELGADEVLDYTEHGDALPGFLAGRYGERPFDAILDTVGVQGLYTASPGYMAPRGMFIAAGGMTVRSGSVVSFLGFFVGMAMNYLYPAFLPGGVDRGFAFHSGSANLADHRELVGLVERGKLRVPIDGVWEMEDAREAYRRMESKRAKGKVVVKVQDL